MADRKVIKVAEDMFKKSFDIFTSFENKAMIKSLMEELENLRREK